MFTLYSLMCPNPAHPADEPRYISIEITGKQRLALQNSMIQDVLPDLDPAVRERYISGWCGPCWKRLWNPQITEAICHDDGETFMPSGEDEHPEHIERSDGTPCNNTNTEVTGTWHATK